MAFLTSPISAKNKHDKLSLETLQPSTMSQDDSCMHSVTLGSDRRIDETVCQACLSHTARRTRMVSFAVFPLLTKIVLICIITLAQAQDGKDPFVQVNFYGWCFSISSQGEFSSQATAVTVTCHLQVKPCARTVPDL